MPEDRETVVIGVAEQITVDPVLPDGVTLRQVDEPTEFARIAAMESEVWDDDFSWVAQDLQARVQAAPHEIVVLVAETDGRVIGHQQNSLRRDGAPPPLCQPITSHAAMGVRHCR